MGFWKELSRAGHKIDAFVGGRGKIGRWNPWSYPERLVIRKIRHKFGWSRHSQKGYTSAGSVNQGINGGYLANTGFRRMV